MLMKKTAEEAAREKRTRVKMNCREGPKEERKKNEASVSRRSQFINVDTSNVSESLTFQNSATPGTRPTRK